MQDKVDTAETPNVTFTADNEQDSPVGNDGETARETVPVYPSTLETVRTVDPGKLAFIATD